MKSKTKEYRAWQAMKYRCYNPKCQYFHCYGERGIRVSPEWINSFDTFFKDMGFAPTPTHSVERIDPDGDYSKNNCKWATTKEQSLNKTNTAKLTIDGIEKPLMEWCELYNIKEKTFRSRIKKGLSIKDALTQAVIKSKFTSSRPNKPPKLFIEFRGERKALIDIAKIYELNYKMLYRRIAVEKIDIERAIIKTDLRFKEENTQKSHF